MCSNLPQTLSSSEEDEVTKQHNHKGSKQKKPRKFIDSGMETGFIFLSIQRCCCYFENVLLYLSSSSKLQDVIEFNFRVPGLEKYLNSTLHVGQVTPNFCLSGALTCLPKFSDSLIIHKPKDGSHA